MKFTSTKPFTGRWMSRAKTREFYLCVVNFCWFYLLIFVFLYDLV